MNELKSEDVVRSIECCLQADGAPACYKLGCPARMGNGLCYYETDCEFGSEEEALKKMLADALALLREYRAKISGLEAEIKKYKAPYTLAVYHGRRQGKINALVERLRNDPSEHITVKNFYEHEIRAEAIDEFVRRIKAHFDTYSEDEEAHALYVRSLVDQIAKEMKGDQDA